MARSYPPPLSNAGAKPVPNLPLALRPQAAARELGVSLNTIRNWTKQGILPCATVGGCTLYSTAALAAWLESQTRAASIGNDAARGDNSGEGVRG